MKTVVGASAVTGVIVAVVVLSLGGSESGSAGPTVVRDPELAAAVRALQAEVARLGSRLEARPVVVAAPPPQVADAPAPVAPPAPVSVAPRAVAAPVPAREAGRAAPKGELAAALAIPRAPGARIPAWDLSRTDDQRRFWRAHLFWSCGQVLERYGAPDQVQVGNGLFCWLYREGRRTTQLSFFDRELVQVEQWEETR